MQRYGEEEIVRPDGIAILMGEGQQAAFFVEMDRGTPIGRIR